MAIVLVAFRLPALPLFPADPLSSHLITKVETLSSHTGTRQNAFQLPQLRNLMSRRRMVRATVLPSLYGSRSD